MRTTRLGDDPPVQNHPAIEVFASFEANGDNAAVTVLVARLGADRCAPDPMARAKPACRPQRQTSPDRFARSGLLSGALMPQTLDRCTAGSRARSGYALSVSTSALALRGFAKPLEGRKP